MTDTRTQAAPQGVPEGALPPAATRRDSWWGNLRLPLLAFCYVAVFLFIDAFADTVGRYFIFCNLLVVSSLYFSWRLGGRETMYYVAFFNIFFAFVFGRLLYLTNAISAPIFLGRSFLVLYGVVVVFMLVMARRHSPADREREERLRKIHQEQNKSRNLELMVATRKLTHDMTKQANLVKDELLLLQNAWRSEIHTIVNDLSPLKERELYERVVKPFEEGIIRHLRGLEQRLSFNPKPLALAALYADLTTRHAANPRLSSSRQEVRFADEGWASDQRLVLVDAYKCWEILLNLIRNAQSANELLQIGLLRQGGAAFQEYRPLIEIRTFLDADRAVLLVTDTGGGLPPEEAAKLFQEPVLSAKRGRKTFGQGTIFAKFFGESMGFSLSAANTNRLGRPGLEIRVTVPFADEAALRAFATETCLDIEPSEDKG